jgi:Xaa-Pro aminopeptidase
MDNIKKICAALPENVDGVLLLGNINQRYATGYGFTDGAVIVGKKQSYLITDSRYIESAQNEVKSATVVMTDRNTKLMDWIKKIISEQDIKVLGFEESAISHAQYEDLERQLPVQLVPVQSVLSTLRASKSASELEIMIGAQRIAEKALDEVLGVIRPGITERELAAEINYRMMRNGADGISFDTIAVAGAKTSMPHGVPGDVVIEKGGFITMDFGCLKDGYCSDMTRTVALGSVTDEMRRVYDIVLEAQLAGIAAARCGVTGMEIDAAARSVIEKAGYGEYFGHGFGHSLGLEIHEAPGANTSGTAVMPAGAVISAEPGIYLPGRFGVRIEDVLYLGENGTQNITLAPKELIVL